MPVFLCTPSAEDKGADRHSTMCTREHCRVFTWVFQRYKPHFQTLHHSHKTRHGLWLKINFQQDSRKVNRVKTPSTRRVTVKRQAAKNSNIVDVKVRGRFGSICFFCCSGEAWLCPEPFLSCCGVAGPGELVKVRGSRCPDSDGVARPGTTQLY